MGTAVLELQTALYALLNSDTALALIGCTIYDEVPGSASFPFLVLSDGMEISWDVFTQGGRHTTFTIHIWSAAEGMQELERIFDRVDTLFHHSPISPLMASYTFALGQREMMSTMRDSDGLTRHLVARYGFYVEENLI